MIRTVTENGGTIAGVDMPLIEKQTSAYDKLKKKRKSTAKSTGKSPKAKDSKIGLAKKKNKSKSRSKSQTKKKKPKAPIISLTHEDNKLNKTKTTRNKPVKRLNTKTAKSKNTDKLNVKSKANGKKVKKKAVSDKSKKENIKKVSKDKRPNLKLNVERGDPDEEQYDQSPLRINKAHEDRSQSEEEEVFTNQSTSTQRNNKVAAFIRNKKSNTSLQVRKSINEGESIEIALASRRSSVRKDGSDISLNRLNKNRSEDKLLVNKNQFYAQNNILFTNHENDYDSVPSPTFITPENENKDLKFEIINVESQISGINNSDVYTGKRAMVNSPEFNNGIREQTEEEDEDKANFDSFKSKEKKLVRDDSPTTNLSGVRKDQQLIFINHMRDEESEDSNVFGVRNDANESDNINSQLSSERVGNFSIPYDSNLDLKPVPKQNTINFN